MGKDPGINFGGPDSLTNAEEYFDLVIFNGGPGIAKEVTWKLEILGYKSGEDSLNGVLPILEPNGNPTVIGYLKKYHKNRSDERDNYRIEKHYSKERELSNEDVKEIIGRSKKIDKYKVYIAHKRIFSNSNDEIVLAFNEDGDFLWLV